MPTVPLAFPKQSNPGRFKANGSARLVNCFLEEQGGEGTVDQPIHVSSGLSLFSSFAGAGGVRAMLATETWLYVVAGRLLWRVDTGGTATQLGSIPTDGPVYMDLNRAVPTQIGICSDGLFWTLVGTTLAQNADLDLPAASSFAVLDGYGILPGFGNAWFITETDDFTAIDPLDFASAESSPDAVLRVATRESELVFFGRDSTEWWRGNVGAEGFPFARVQTARLGCLSAGSVTTVGQTLGWIANDKDGNVFCALMEGYSGRPISTHAVERTIRDEADPDAITATSWGEDGHTFVAWSGTDWTWVYDVKTGLWHERKSYRQDRWRCSVVTSFGGRLIAGDATEGKIYEMHRDYTDEAGTDYVVEMVTPTHHAFPDKMRIDALHLGMVMGQGAVPGTSSTTDPQIMIAMSKDGGATWGPERMMSLGTRGERIKRIVPRRWGKVDDKGAVFKFSVSASVARGFLHGALEAERLK